MSGNAAKQLRSEVKKYAFTLAEVFSPLCAGCCKIAFTLAEVLITLAIIGVVAALTMPTLIANYQKQVTVNQLKKSYSLWSQVFQKILADDGVDRLSDTELWSKMPIYGCNQEDFDTDCKDFVTALQKYINIDIYPEKDLQWKNSKTATKLGTTSGSALVTKDGTLLRIAYFHVNPYTKNEKTCKKIKELGGTQCSTAVGMYIDINGIKQPNTIGKDVFGFEFSNEGKLYPRFGKDNALFNSQESLETNENYWKNVTYAGFICDKDGGESCAARIMENAWKIDY